MTKSQELSYVVKAHRKAAKLSRASLAEMAGVGKTVIYDIENGKETIQLNTLRKILKVLNIRIELISPLMDHLHNENEKG
ncbi:MAG: helix-turn-helix transcriptional regulator [Bacteroidales bacterium]|nr:helix-turn-helix transcriptional regulator [Bacteroidales bacterium]MBK7627129.1 helix-turn-helix transcriptional regulator [Bacteroidales bacterium]